MIVGSLYLLACLAAPAAGEPSPAAQLAAFEGTWDWTATMVWGGRESEFGAGQDKLRLVAGGKAIEFDSRGTEGGQAVEAVGLLGWHGPEKRFYWFMASSSHAGPISQQGDLKDGRIVLDDLKTGGDNPMVVHTEMELPTGDTWTIAMRFTKPDGTLLGTVDYHYRRAAER